MSYKENNLLDFYAHSTEPQAWKSWTYPLITNPVAGNYEISWNKGQAVAGYYVKVFLTVNGERTQKVSVYVDRVKSVTFTVPLGTDSIEVTTPSNIEYVRVFRLRPLVNLWNYNTNSWATAGLNKSTAVISQDGSSVTVTNHSGASLARLYINKGMKFLDSNKSYQFRFSGDNLSVSQHKSVIQVFLEDNTLIFYEEFYGECLYTIPPQQQRITFSIILYQEDYTLGSQLTAKIEIVEI